MGDWTRALTEPEVRRVAAARRKAEILYEGRLTPHRSCGIAMAETFSRAPGAYQVLRRGGITGTGECGVVVGGRLVLGEILGDPDPTGPVTPSLRTAMSEYDARWSERIDRRGAPAGAVVCNALTAQFPDFVSAPRAGFCTSLAADVAALVAEVLVRNDVPFEVTPIPGVAEEER